MRQRALRRDVLRSVIGGAALAAIPVGVARGQSNERQFTPDRHGFGFRNWSSRRQAFELPDETIDPSRNTVQESITTSWPQRAADILGVNFAQVNQELVEILTTQLRSEIVQRAGTNGHCYGMALAAQSYFEMPETLPLDREFAAAIRHPTEPLTTADAPIYHEIVQLQAEQILRFRTWLGRRALVWPDRIDVEAQLDDIRAVIDVFGTAQVSVFDSRISGHQVLAYDYEEHDDSVSVYVYDPNYPASTYEHQTQVIEFTETADGIVMEPYGRYRWVLFNRYDRIEDATGRSTATPLDHVNLDAAQLREAIFPTALVTVDTSDIDLTIVNPNGGRLGRIRGEFMDRSRGPVSRLRSAYGAAAGDYQIRLYGHQSTTYELAVRIAGPNGSRLSVVHSDQIEAEETQVFTATVPETADETGTFELTEQEFGRIPVAIAAASGGLVVGVGAHYAWQKRQRRKDSERR